MRSLAVLACLFATLGCESALVIEPPGGFGGGGPVLIDSGTPTGSDAGGLRPDSGGPFYSDAGRSEPVDSGPGCVPNCTGRQCGDDGCGGTCAPGCASDEDCANGTCMRTSALCPPTGSTGNSVGNVAPDMEFPLVGGGTMSVRDLCAGPAFIYRFSESCGICRSWLNSNADALYRELNGQGLSMMVVVGVARRADGSYGPPDIASATRIRDEYGLSMPVAIEEDNLILWTLHRSGAGVSLLMEEGNVIAEPVGRVSDSTVRGMVP